MWTLGIRDKWLLGIIRAMLHAPIVLPNGKVEHPKKGVPQGGLCRARHKPPYEAIDVMPSYR